MAGQDDVDVARMKRTEALVRMQVEIATRIANELPPLPDPIGTAARFNAILHATAITSASVNARLER